MRRSTRAAILLVAFSLLPATSTNAGTISVSFSLTSGAGSWSSGQSAGPVSLGMGAVFLEVAGTSIVSPTGSNVTVLSLFATGLASLGSANSLQLFGLTVPVVATSPTNLSAVGGGGTLGGAVGGPSGVFPLLSHGAIFLTIQNLQTNGSAVFRLFTGNFGGATSASVVNTFVGTEVSRTFVPEPSTGSLLALGLVVAVACVGTRRR